MSCHSLHTVQQKQTSFLRASDVFENHKVADKNGEFWKGSTFRPWDGASDSGLFAFLPKILNLHLEGEREA